MLLIRDAQGEIIGAQVEHPKDSEIMSFIAPAEAGQSLHRLLDAPAELCEIAHPAEFHRALTYQVKLDHAKVSRTSVEELDALFLGSRFGERSR